jgi:hypothetical protein
MIAMKKSGLFLIIAAAISMTIVVSCSKENNDRPTALKVNMTDAPVAYDEVNVDLEEVRVKFRDGDSLSSWMTLNTHAGIYNLLGLMNGVDTLIAMDTLPTNMVKEIRLVLGTDNSIVVSGTPYPLTIPSGSESGLKIKVNKTLSGSLDSLLIDFDAALSIHQTGTGEYQLRPVLKLK